MVWTRCRVIWYPGPPMAIVKGGRRSRPGRWPVDVRDAAGIRRIITCRTSEEARRIEAAKHYEWRQRIVSMVDANITLDDYVPRWLAQVKVTAKPRTRALYETAYRDHIRPRLGERKAADDPERAREGAPGRQARHA